MLAAKEAGNAAFKAQQWQQAHDHYSTAIAQHRPHEGSEAFFAQCHANRYGLPATGGTAACLPSVLTSVGGADSNMA